MIMDEETNTYQLLRLPSYLESSLSPQGRLMNRSSIGVELRFKMFDEEIELELLGKNEFGRCFIYFGMVQGEWYQSSFVIDKNKVTTIKIKKSTNPGLLKKMNQEKKSIYPSDMIRVIFDGTRIQFKGIRGQVSPYLIDNKKYLAYGSSITANSICFIPELSYCGRIARYLGLDLINVGSPGSCEILPVVADYLSTYQFEISTIELGINIINQVSVDEYADRCNYFLKTMISSHPNSIFYIVDIFSYFNRQCGVSNDKVEAYAQKLKSICHKFDNVYYLSGKKLLKHKNKLCADLVHPDLDGHIEIYRNLKRSIKEIENERKNK